MLMATPVALLVFGYVCRKCRYKRKKAVPNLHKIIGTIEQFYNNQIEWKFAAKVLKTYEKEGALGPFLWFCGIPLQFAIIPFILQQNPYSQYPTREYKKYLVLIMNARDIQQDNLIHFTLLVSVNYSQYRKKIAFNTIDFNMDSRYNPKTKYWVIQPNIDNNRYYITHDEAYTAQENWTLSVDLLEMKYFQMNTIHSIKWWGMNTKRGSFENHVFDIYWDEIDRKILMNFKLLEMPCKVLALCLKVEFKSVHDKVLCTDEQALRKDNAGNIKYTKFRWKGKKLISANRMVMTVTKVFDLSVREVPLNEWIEYGFIA